MFVVHSPFCRKVTNARAACVKLAPNPIVCEDSPVKVAVKSALMCVSFAVSYVFVHQAAADSINVILDQAKIVRLPERVTTLVIGNPLVADGALQAGGLMVVTGKNYGTTNMIALDSRGEVLVEHTVTVGAPKENTLTVWRGVARETWSCAPRCEQSVMLGDDSKYFETAIGQAQTRAGQATGQAPQTPQ
jgi:hypothetical protein